MLQENRVEEGRRKVVFSSEVKGIHVVTAKQPRGDCGVIMEELEARFNRNNGQPVKLQTFTRYMCGGPRPGLRGRQ